MWSVVIEDQRMKRRAQTFWSLDTWAALLSAAILYMCALLPTVTVVPVEEVGEGEEEEEEGEVLEGSTRVLRAALSDARRISRAALFLPGVEWLDLSVFPSGSRTPSELFVKGVFSPFFLSLLFFLHVVEHPCALKQQPGDMLGTLAAPRWTQVSAVFDKTQRFVLSWVSSKVAKAGSHTRIILKIQINFIFYFLCMAATGSQEVF